MKQRITILLLLAIGVALPAQAAVEEYIFDKKGTHAFIQWRIQHLGFSWLYGQFNDFDGKFSYDPENPSASKVEVVINTASVDSNHALRDKHLRDEDFLNVEEHPTARFVSKSLTVDQDGQGELKGFLTLNGVTREVVITTEQVGAGDDPWGGFRRGFHGTTTLKLADFNIKKDLGPHSQTVELMLSVEGIRQ